MKKTNRCVVLGLAASLATAAILAPLAAAQSGQPSGGKERGEVILVAPNRMYANETSTFAVRGLVEGEVVLMQSVQGEVILQKTPDNLGRVVTSLGAGSYAISVMGKGGSRSVGNLNVIDSPATPPAQADGIKTGNLPQYLKRGEPFRLAGQGFSGNASEMSTSIGPVLASTPREIAVLPESDPGKQDFTVSNKATGKTSEAKPTTIYNMTGQLRQRTIGTGTPLPRNRPAPERPTSLPQ